MTDPTKDNQTRLVRYIITRPDDSPPKVDDPRFNVRYEVIRREDGTVNVAAMKRQAMRDDWERRRTEEQSAPALVMIALPTDNAAKAIEILRKHYTRDEIHLALWSGK
jgi:hypothetical protein